MSDTNVTYAKRDVYPYFSNMIVINFLNTCRSYIKRESFLRSLHSNQCTFISVLVFN